MAEPKASAAVGAFMRTLAFLILGLIGVGVLFGSACAVVPAGHRGVQLQQSAVTGAILNEGWHIQAPFLQRVEVLSVQTQAYHSKASAASRNLQAVDTEVTLTYKLDPQRVAEVYQNLGIGYEGRIVAPAILEKVKAVTAEFEAERLITERSRVRQEIEDSIRTYLRQFGIEVVSVQLTNFDFSKEFNDSIEKKQVAEQRALTAKNDLDRIRIEAEQRISQAKGEAEAIRIQGEALQNNPRLVELEAVKKWDGRLPATNLGGGAVPFITIPATGQTVPATPGR
jgi:prohibitin 2